MPTTTLLASLPIAIWIAVGAMLAHQQPTLPAPGVSLGSLIVAAGSAGLLYATRHHHHRSTSRQLLLIATCTLAGIGWAQWQAHDRLIWRINSASQGAQRIVDALIEQMPTEAQPGVRFVARVVRCMEEGGDCRSGQRLRFFWRTPTEAIEPGQVWRIRSRWRLPQGPQNPHGFDAELRALQEEVAATGSVLTAWRLDAGDSDVARRSTAGLIDTTATSPPLDWAAALRITVEQWRAFIAQRIAAATPALDGNSRGIVLGLVIGDQAAIGPTAWALFNRTGIGHLLSISGGHVTLLAALCSGTVALLWRNRRLARRCARLTGRPLAGWVGRPTGCWVAAVVAAFLYAGLAGWGLPAQRTCWMLLAAGAMALSGRARGPIPVLGTALLVIILADPWAPLSPGCWLSFVAVGVILMVSQRRSIDTGPLRSSWRRRLSEGLRSAARAQWAVTVAMLPMGAWLFASASWISPFVNALAIPLVSIVITPVAIGGALLACVSIDAGGFVLNGIGAVVSVSIAALESFDRWADGLRHFSVTMGVPGPWVFVLSMTAAIAVLLPWPIERRVWLGLGLLPLLIAPVRSTPSDELHIQVIDVGQGMAILIEGAGFRLLYDAGPGSSAGSDAGARIVVPWLRSQGITQLDALVISHDDEDHVGGAQSVLASLEVDRVYGALSPSHPVAQAARAFTPCRRGERWQWGDTRFEWLHPWPSGLAAAYDEYRTHSPAAPSSGPQDARTRNAQRPPSKIRDNTLSCVLRIDSPAGSVLLPGDIESRQERELLSATLPERLKADLLFAPHHGSASSSSAAFVRAVDPRTVVFQVGYRNRFDHPRAVVVDRYRQQCAELLRSDAAGAISIRMRRGEPWQVNRWRADGARYWHVDMSALDAQTAAIDSRCVLR